MSIVLAIIGVLCGFVLEGSAGALFGGVLGFTLGRVVTLSSETKLLKKDLKQLSTTLAKDWELRSASRPATSSAKHKVEVSESGTERASVKKEHADELVSTAQPKVEEPESSVSEIPKATAAAKVSESPVSPLLSSLTSLDALTARIKSYFTEGNLFVRIGILVLFFGVGFLFKYAAEHSVFPIELRLASVATGDWPFLNSAYIGSVMVAFAGNLSAYYLYQAFTGRKSWEITLSPVFLVWGLFWWFAGAFHQFEVFLDKNYLNAALLFYAVLICALFGHLEAGAGTARQPDIRTT